MMGLNVQLIETVINTQHTYIHLYIPQDSSQQQNRWCQCWQYNVDPLQDDTVDYQEHRCYSAPGPAVFKRNSNVRAQTHTHTHIHTDESTLCSLEHPLCSLKHTRARITSLGDVQLVQSRGGR